MTPEPSIIRRLALVALVSASQTAFAQSASPPVGESASAAGKLGYASVAAALEGLKAMPGVSITVTQPDRWVIAVEPDSKAMWSFTPPGHYAHPAVVRREVKERDGKVYVEMTALCQASQERCDALIREFQALNERMAESVRNRLPGQK